MNKETYINKINEIGEKSTLNLDYSKDYSIPENGLELVQILKKNYLDIKDLVEFYNKENGIK